MADDQKIVIGLAVQTESAGIKRAKEELTDVRKRINDLKGEFRTGGKNVDTFSSELKKLTAEANKLEKALDAAASERKFSVGEGVIDPATLGTGGKLRDVGRSVRNLPSIQIPGTSVGTDAIGNISRVAGAIAKVGAETKVAALAANALTPALGAQAAATAAAYAPVALLAAGIAVIGLGLKKLSDDTSSNADKIEAYAEEQRKLNEEIANGLTTEEAVEELKRLTEAQARNKELVSGLQSEYAGAERELGALSGAVKVFSGDEESLHNQINETNETITKQQDRMDSLTRALNDGSLAANDAAEAEKKLQQERTQGILSEAAQQNELVQLRERSADMTAQQIAAELENIERRRLGIEAELAVLEGSGDKSEEVSQKIKQLTDQLGFLGDQANVLKNATPKASDSGKAQKEAAKEQEKAAKDAARATNDAAKAQQAHADKLRDIGQRFRDAIADIGTGLRDATDDNQREYLDSLAEDTLKFQQDELKEERKFRRDLKQIRRDAAREALDATRARDFAALRDSREKASEAIQDRKQQEADENSEQLIEQRNHYDALARERDIANRDALIDAERARRDASIDRSRAYRDAQQELNSYHRDRAAQEQNFMRSSLTGWQGYFDQLSKMQGGAGGSKPKSGSSGTTPTYDDFQFVISGG